MTTPKKKHDWTISPEVLEAGKRSAETNRKAREAALKSSFTPPRLTGDSSRVMIMVKKSDDDR